MRERIIVAIASAAVGGVFTYAVKALTMEGRLDGIERAIVRIEARLYSTDMSNAK